MSRALVHIVCDDRKRYGALLAELPKRELFGVPVMLPPIEQSRIPDLQLFVELGDYALTTELRHQLQGERDGYTVASTVIDDDGTATKITSISDALALRSGDETKR